MSAKPENNHQSGKRQKYWLHRLQEVKNHLAATGDFFQQLIIMMVNDAKASRETNYSVDEELGAVEMIINAATDLKEKMLDQLAKSEYQHPPFKTFTYGWGKISLPFTVRVAVIDKIVDKKEIGLSDMQIMQLGQNNFMARLSFNHRCCDTEVIESVWFDQNPSSPDSVRITQEVAKQLSCKVGDWITIYDAAEVLTSVENSEDGYDDDD